MAAQPPSPTDGNGCPPPSGTLVVVPPADAPSGSITTYQGPDCALYVGENTAVSPQRSFRPRAPRAWKPYRSTSRRNGRIKARDVDVEEVPGTQSYSDPFDADAGTRHPGAPRLESRQACLGSNYYRCGGLRTNGHAWVSSAILFGPNVRASVQTAAVTEHYYHSDRRRIDCSTPVSHPAFKNWIYISDTYRWEWELDKPAASLLGRAPWGWLSVLQTGLGAPPVQRAYGQADVFARFHWFLGPALGVAHYWNHYLQAQMQIAPADISSFAWKDCQLAGNPGWYVGFYHACRWGFEGPL
jgi:hypothetical protein